MNVSVPLFYQWIYEMFKFVKKIVKTKNKNSKQKKNGFLKF